MTSIWGAEGGNFVAWFKASTPTTYRRFDTDVRSSKRLFCLRLFAAFFYFYPNPSAGLVVYGSFWEAVWVEFLQFELSRSLTFSKRKALSLLRFLWISFWTTLLDCFNYFLFSMKWKGLIAFLKPVNGLPHRLYIVLCLEQLTNDPIGFGISHNQRPN